MLKLLMKQKAGDMPLPAPWQLNRAEIRQVVEQQSREESD